MKSSPFSQHSFIHKHKLPSKLVGLLKSSESSSVVGFGATQEQQDFMLLTALLASQNTIFFEELKQELDEYFLTLSNSLQVNCKD